MKYCVSTYSFGGYLDSLGIRGVIDKAAELGFEGIEFVDGGYLDIPDEEIAAIGAYAREKGLETVDLCVGADLWNGDTESGVAALKKNVDKALLLGCKLMRHDVAYSLPCRKYGIGYSDALLALVPACREVTEYAASKGVRTMTENHGYFSQDAERVMSLINGVGHPNFGALVDLGNFMCADEDPAVSVSKLIPYAFHIHAKDFLFKPGTEIAPDGTWFSTRAGNHLRGAVIGHGCAKIPQSIGIVKRSGYDGWISVEFEGVEDNLRGIELGLANLKRYAEIM